MDDRPSTGAPKPARAILASLFLLASWLAFDPVDGAIRAPLLRAAGLHMVADGQLAMLAYGVLVAVRLLLDLLLVAGVLAILGRRWSGFPLRGPRAGTLTVTGLLIGLVVMMDTILAIVATGNATVAVSAQRSALGALHGIGWLIFDYLGAAGEELFGRVAVLLVAERFVGRRGAILVSGLTFSGLHLVNPGADWVWLLRLFVQGALLAFAVYRTGSVWWSIGYHAGWNWASAPLFGAAGSGYLDQGHLLDFRPGGSHWITGGAIGPEGSVFAFVAVLCACGLLLTTTRRERLRRTAR